MARRKKAPNGAPAVISINDPAALPQRLALVRGGMDQAAFAHRIGFSVNTVGRYEREERSADAKYLQAVCHAYPEINPAWLLVGMQPQLLSDLQAGQSINERALLTALVWIENEIENKGLQLEALQRGQILMDVYQTLLTAPSRVNPKFVLAMFKAHTE